MPTGERLVNVMEMYAMLGFPGAIGSMDATHIRLGKCPAHILSVYWQGTLSNYWLYVRCGSQQDN